MRIVLCLGLSLFLFSGCKAESNSVFSSLNSLIYKSFGISIGNDASSLSIKELRLSGNIIESEVEIEGQVEEVSANNTYFVISDQTARLLVVTTEVLPTVRDVVFQNGKGSNVKVIGKVEIGKKGLPFLKASAITKSEALSENGQKS
jgi:hypothetical protein